MAARQERKAKKCGLAIYDWECKNQAQTVVSNCQLLDFTDY